MTRSFEEVIMPIIQGAKDQGFIAGAESRQYEVDKMQNRIDEYNKKVEKFINYLIETEVDDGDGIHEYWSGFAECAGSVADVFIRDVGFLDLKDD